MPSDKEFTDFILKKGRELYRDMPWRQDTRPYYILVSEIMLQQTQVPRVIPKFNLFIQQFPTVTALARASQADVLGLWSGLGYNRRALYLKRAAEKIVAEFGGNIPTSTKDLLTLPGVGKNTAGAVRVYAFNMPELFVETNVRTVYIHHFFASKKQVDDGQILQKLDGTVATDKPREFYWALMDYGSWLKAQGVANIAQSRHYKKQSPLEGSVRQMRGMIVKRLSGVDILTIQQLSEQFGHDNRYKPALSALVSEKMISVDGDLVYLTK